MRTVTWAHYYAMSLLMKADSDHWWARVNPDGTYVLYDRHGRAEQFKAASRDEAIEKSEQHAVAMTVATTEGATA